MKRIATLFLLSITTTIFAQDNTTTNENSEASVTKSQFGVQIGTFGTWIYNESKLTNKIALRSELGLQFFTIKNNNTNESHSFLTPEITLEPRFYYNLNNRSSKGKNISGNSGNYFSLRSSYYPDSFIVGNANELKFVPELSIIPSWGMKRNLGTHFNYELGGGIGYRRVFEKGSATNSNNLDVTSNLHIRIGYRF
jgi:hypothetical protein